MSDLLALVGIGVAVFVSTNIDDVLLLAVFFADPQIRVRNVVVGQYLGNGLLVAASWLAAWASLVVPEGYPALLGLVPLGLGLYQFWELREGRVEQDVEKSGHRRGGRWRSQVLAVAGVTAANGGDNLGVYIPLFAKDTSTIPVYVLVFAIMTAIWCWAGYTLVRHRAIGAQIQRYGHIALPVVLVALGLWILAGARVLLH